MLYTIWLYAIRRKTECNRFRKKMYVIHRRWNVINPRERNIQVLRLDDIPFALQTDYIRLTAITYQSFGLDKNKALPKKSFIFWRHHPDLNWGIKVLQTSALPLGYGAEKNGAGYEARTRYLHLGKVALYQMG